MSLMWYIPYEIENNFKKLYLRKDIKKIFFKFCEQEVFWNNQGKLSEILEKTNKNFFLEKKLNDSLKLFSNWVLAVFYEKQIPLTQENLVKFFSENSKTNPLETLVLGSNYRFLTIKTTQFLASITPGKDSETEKEYLNNFQIIYMNEFFSSLEFKEVLKNHAIDFLEIFDQLKKIEKELSDFENDTILTINTEIFLKTDFISKMDIEREKFLLYLSKERFIYPTMPIYQAVMPKTLFEYAMLHANSFLIQWIKDSLVEFEQYFYFSPMIKHFERLLEKSSYFKKFSNELENYENILKYMRQIEFKYKMNAMLQKEEDNQKTKGKI